jgi:hypothetical protein
MTFQVLFNSAQSIEIDRRKVVGQSISRSQRIKSAERVTAQPFVLTVKPIAVFPYTTTRTIFEAIQNYDRTAECVVNIANTPNLHYLTRYQGDFSVAERAAMTITNFTGTSVTIAVNTSTSGYIFRGGDWIQPTNSRYPYIVTEDVINFGSFKTFQVHRPLITSENTNTNTTMKIGTATTMVVVAQEFPTYRIIRRDWAEYTGDFVFVEKII